MITLYDCATAPNPRRARLFLAEKGLLHETVHIDLRAGEHMTDAYRRINPRCTVPALRVDDALVLSDNAAIAAYLEAQYPQPPLLGRSAQDKAEIASLNWRMELDGLMPVAEALRNSSPAMVDRAMPGPVNYPQIPELAQRGHARAQRFFAELNDHLAGRSFVAAEQFSVADITAVVAVDFARVIKLKPDPNLPHLMRWRAAMAERPSMQV